MTNNVIPMFAFGDHKLCAVMIEGEPWFVAADACAILCLNGGNGTQMHVAKLDADERLLATRAGHPQLFRGSFAGKMTLVSRPGLLKMIARSNKPEARKFDRWVRHEVLPQIMDNGGYVAPDAYDQAELLPGALGGLKGAIERLRHRRYPGDARSPR